MKYEKSCGAVIFRTKNGIREYLIVLNKKGNADGHWGFPKGHTELGENEYTTAAREILEETGLYVVFCKDARCVSHYSPKQGVEKDAVYFLAQLRDEQEISLQTSEICDAKWCCFEEAMELLTFDQKILKEMERFF